MLKRTALFEEHKRLGGRLIDFGGWELPVQYSGVINEHLACREKVGIFDVSHMGEIHVEGPKAEAYLDYLVSNHVAKLSIHQALYSAMCNERGGIVDDLVIYRRAADRFLVVVNASNTEKDFAHMKKTEQSLNYGTSLKVSNQSAHYSQIALQGRFAAEILQTLTDLNLSSIKTYWFLEGKVLGEIQALVARTGYTGEDGFEIYVPWGDGPRVWRALLEKGNALGIKPCGLGARDTLRLEMKYPLYGNELSDETNPLEAGLGWVVKLDKGNFVGSPEISLAKQKGLSRALVGIKLLDRGIPRSHYKVFDERGEKEIGEITSGTQSPSLKESIGIAYVSKDYAKTGGKLRVDIRGVKVLGEIIPTPFYRKNY